MSEVGSDGRDLALVLAAWIFALEYSLYLVAEDLADKPIKLAAASVMLLCLHWRRDEMRSREKSLLILFCVLLLTALVPSVFVGDMLTGISQWMKFALMTIVLPLLLIGDRAAPGKYEWLVSGYLWLGILFAVQAIAAFAGVFWGLLDTSNVIEIGRRPGLVETTLGPLGFANAIRTPLEDTRWLRPQGWFLEPSILGAFLLLPAFLSLGRFLQHRQLAWLPPILVLFTAIFLTASFAAYSGVVLGSLFLMLSRPLFIGLPGVLHAFRYTYPVLILAVFAAIAAGLMTLSNQASQIDISELDTRQAILTHVYARDPASDSGNLVREAANSDLYLSTVAANPLGIGFAATQGENEVLAADGVLFWTVAGGLPALGMLAILFGYIFYAFCHPLLISGNPVHRCIAASFIGHAVHNVSYGNWLAPYFLIHLTIVCMTLRPVGR